MSDLIKEKALKQVLQKNIEDCILTRDLRPFVTQSATFKSLNFLFAVVASKLTSYYLPVFYRRIKFRRRK